MKEIRTFDELTAHLKSLKTRKKIAVVCAYDEHTEYAVSRALDENIAEIVLLGDADKTKDYPLLKKHAQYVTVVDIKDSDEAAAEAVRMVRDNEVEILMKGIINTDNLLRAILNKEKGILPKGKVLTHLAVMEIPAYDKLLFFLDAAVIPYPTLEQRIEMIKYAVTACNQFGIEEPKVALTHCTEKVNPKFPFTLDYETLKEMAKAGDFGKVIMDGPMDVKTACDSESGDIKGIASPINGQADILMFPNIESGNTFYKSMTRFAKGEMAGILQGPSCPIVLPSRSDHGLSKYYSIALACLNSNK
ncbi:phosphate butyryltransferase [Dysgonomonas sp. PH5-45]|uniref:phosphate acyltransferase n=1 Tax=unclassified Dysgonomonas TaxID=2630389 RepID=UPI002474B01B|nr:MULTISPECIES: phosphate acyltransferase [unclassified Dysgonomonas]MDH6355339.1 phosphate butyryltransferase [Dysgonomonas sp. PH5-45]MDH6388237.1 phosphate butyryltransferase [Dysgonomonas sp. PH5-37]